MIPQMIHCIWLGSMPPNDQHRPHRRRLLDWKSSNPDWAVWLWTDRVGLEWTQLAEWCENHQIVLRSVLDDASVLWGDERTWVLSAIDDQFWATASDLLRLRILYQCGGLYVDSDVEPIVLPSLDLPLGIGMVLRMAEDRLSSIAPHALAAAPGHTCLQIALWKGIENLQLLETVDEPDFRKSSDPVQRYGGTLVLTGDLLRPSLLRVEGVFSTPDFGWSPWLESMRLPFTLVHREENQWLSASEDLSQVAPFFPPALSIAVRQSWTVYRLTSILHWLAAYGPAWLIEHAKVVADPFQDYFGSSPRGVATQMRRSPEFIASLPAL